MNTRWLKIVVFSLLSVAATAEEQPSSDGDALNQRGLELLMQFNEGTRGLQGRFTQRVSRDGESGEYSEGRFRLLRPGKFVWTYETPDEQIIVADGTNLWNYDVLLDQVDVRPQADALADSPATILSGGGDPLDAFDYHGSFEQEAVLWVQLAPKTEESDFGVLRLGFKDGLLAGMQLGDNLDQVTVIEFEDVVENPTFNNDDFTFIVPDGVDVYGAPAGGSEDEDVTPVVGGLG
ncbi:MAG: outer membrane lipoprotein carrier protein LolA [Pseudomonadota bacterium]